MANVITNRDGLLSSVTGPKGMDAYRLRVLASGLKLEMKCPGLKMSRIGALAAAKRVTGLKSNSRAKHLEAVEAMLAAAVSECQVVNHP